MSWPQRVVGIVMLVVLIGLPVGGTVCDVLCSIPAVPAGTSATVPDGTSGAAAAHHHHPDAESEAPPAFSRVQPRGPSTDDCNGHTDTIREESAMTAVRADWDIVSSPLGVVLARTASPAVAAANSEAAYSPPLGSAPPTGTPLVLRV